MALGDRVCGFIIAVRDDLPWAYKIPMQAALDDMKRTLGTSDIRIPTADEIAALRTQLVSEDSGSFRPKHPSVSGILSTDQSTSMSELQSGIAGNDAEVTSDELALSNKEMRSHALLWLQENPGSGKSTFMKPVESLSLGSRAPGAWTGKSTKVDGLHSVSSASHERSLFARMTFIKKKLRLKHFRTSYAGSPILTQSWPAEKLTASLVEAYSIRVRSKIASKMKENWENKKYIPRNALDAIFWVEPIMKLVKEDESLDMLPFWHPNSGSHVNKDHFAQKVSAFAPRLLALCIYVDLPLACLHWLMANKLDDFSLPLHTEQSPQDMYRTKWDFMIMIQGGFFAHSFPEKPNFEHQQLSSSTVVLITFDKSSNLLGEGSFGRVFEISIDSDHHSFSRDRSTTFALKSFFKQGTRAEADFKHEVHVLRRLSEAPHPNLITQLASWTQGGSIYMLMARAESNLKSFMKISPNPELTSRFVTSLLSQIKGLADAVRYMHNLESLTEPRQTYTGFHHDLKPANILVFQENEKGLAFKLSDFGSARIGLQISGSDLQSESYFTNDSGHNSAAYGAPDFHQSGRASRPYDI